MGSQHREVIEFFNETVEEYFGPSYRATRKNRKKAEADHLEGRRIALSKFSEELKRVADDTHPVILHVFQHHSESNWGVCRGCDNWESGALWPCSTIILLAKELKVTCPVR